jgi:type I restriction enzyme, S subunit
MSSGIMHSTDPTTRQSPKSAAGRALTGPERGSAKQMPDAWCVSTVGTEFEIQLGKMLDAAKNTGVLKSYIGNRAVQWGRFDLAQLSEIRMTPTDLHRYRLRTNDLLVCEGGEVGRAAIWNDPIAECYYQKALHRLRPRGAYDVRLMMYFLQLWASTRYLENFVTQTSIAHLPKDKLEVVPLPTPSTAEQRAIAEALSDVDGLLVALETLIAKKRAIKQAAMQQLLTGKTRLPGFIREWETFAIGDVADRKVPYSLAGGPFGSNLKSAEYTNSGVRIIQLQNIGDGVFHDDYAIFTSDEKADELRPCNIYPGEIILSKMGDPVARACLVPPGPNRYLMASDGIRLSVDRERFSTKFALYFINHAEFRAEAIAASSGSTRLRIALSALKRLSFRAPGLDEQRAIATVLSDMDAEITALEARRDKTRAIKQGMMQQLLTGRVRLMKPAPEETSA